MIQLQPIKGKYSDFQNIADERNLFFEVLELSFDNYSDETYNWYMQNKRVKSFHGVFIDVNPGSGDSDIRSLSEKKYNESCQTAIQCGCENVVFHSTCFPFLRGGYLECWADKCAEFYSLLAEKYSSLNLFIENSFDIDPEPISCMMKRINNKNVGVCLDIGHINYSNASVDQWFDALGEKTAYIHLSDNNGKFDDHLTLGKGIVPLKRASELCAFLPAETPVTLEVGGIESIEESLDYLKENGLFGGLI